MKTVYIETLGCSKNQVDSEKMKYVLEDQGYSLVDEPEDAEIIIVNTCGFITSAKEEAIETILELNRYKEEGTCKKLVVAGCLAERYSSHLQKEIPEIDTLFGIGDISRIGDAVSNDTRVLIPDYERDVITGRVLEGYPGSAYVKISEGCSNYCSYCIIPQIRGPLRSRSINDILKEVKLLKIQDVKEFIIIGQDVANFGIDTENRRMLGELIDRMDALLEEEDWIRVLYMHPHHVDSEILDQLASSSHFIPYFDIPAQSGSTTVLDKMGRSHDREAYLELIASIRGRFPEAVFRSSFITGFPGETDEDLEQTLDLIEEAGIDWVGGFTYSPEEGTRAYNMDGHVDESEKEERLQRLVKHGESVSLAGLKRFIGTRQRVLIEERVEGEPLYIGRFFGQAPDVDGLTVVSGIGISQDGETLQIGTFVNTVIRQLNGHDFFAVTV
jgi:ribosomal protein S12 methylthiotransferase